MIDHFITRKLIYIDEIFHLWKNCTIVGLKSLINLPIKTCCQQVSCRGF